jgi:hypothetical protein
MVMKQSQWIVAAVLLAGLVFLVTFAMNYLGSRPAAPQVTQGAAQRELKFYWKAVPGPAYAAIEAEEKAPGHQDFWFLNENKEPVKVGLRRKGCKCTAVELFVLPPSEAQGTVAELIARGGPSWNAQGPHSFFDGLLTPTFWSDPKAGDVLQALTAGDLASLAVSPAELLRSNESVTVPGGALGWVRLRWKAEKAGRQALAATLWLNEEEFGPSATLEVRAIFHDALRVKPRLELGILREEQLAGRGVTQEIICWSSTRPDLRLEARSGEGLGKPGSDPFVVGTPIRMTDDELQKLEETNNQESASPIPTIGRVLAGYRIPVTLLAVSPDGKTPFEIGPFRRHITLSSPDVPEDSKQVAVVGRVRGPVLIGTEEDRGEIDFRPFPHSRGSSTERIVLQSDVPGLHLQLDTERTAGFLEIRLRREKDRAAGRRVWNLTARVKPKMATGVFPRREDPLFADSAVYLKMTIPGKPPGSVRIATRGTATAQ